MVNKFTPVTDLETLWETNFTHANVSGISAKPDFTRKGVALGSPAYATGLVQFKKSRLLNNLYRGIYYRDETYAVDVDVFFQGNENTLREIVGELDRINNVNNQSPAKTYDFTLIYEWSGDIDIGKIECVVIAEKTLVGVPI